MSNIVFRFVVLCHFYIGKRGFQLARANVADKYGFLGSKGVEWNLATWKNP